MSEEQKKQLEQQLWNIANTLRGKMNADEFRDYILGFIFYKYLSERMNLYADSILEADGITYQSINENTDEGKLYLEAIREESLTKLGYFFRRFLQRRKIYSLSSIRKFAPVSNPKFHSLLSPSKVSMSFSKLSLNKKIVAERD